MAETVGAVTSRMSSSPLAEQSAAKSKISWADRAESAAAASITSSAKKFKREGNFFGQKKPTPIVFLGGKK